MSRAYAMLYAAMLCCIVSTVNAEPADGLELGGEVTITAHVVGLDYADRIVSVRGPRGNTVEIEAGDEVQNFDQINIGDDVNVTYYESVALYVGEPGTLPETDATVVSARAKKGDKPSAMMLGAVDISAVVKAIDKEKRELNLEYPDGHLATTHVNESIERFDTLKIGDTIHARVTRALAIAVEAHQ